MTTKVWGTSDDLIELEGDIHDEIGFSNGYEDSGCLLAFSDGTLLEVKYGKGRLAVWSIVPLNKGPLFDRIDVCDDEDDDPYSDIAYLKDGVTSVCWAREWQRLKAEKRP